MKPIHLIFFVLSITILSNCKNKEPSLPISIEVKLININLAAGLQRCFRTNPETGANCAANCEVDCSTQDSTCIRLLLKIESAFQEFAKILQNQFAEGELGIICLQEVNTNIDGVNLVELITNELNETWNYTFFSPTNTTYGIGIISNIANSDKQFWDLPVPDGKEKRGAIAMKFDSGTNSIWVVNTHLGLTKAEQIDQVNELKNQYLSFDENIPVVICGDFNILDIEHHGANVSITQEVIEHYENTIAAFTESGIKKLDFKNTEKTKYTFPSWSMIEEGATIDYIFWSKAHNGTVPEMTTLTPGLLNATPENSFCPEFKSEERYFSDHNGMMIQFPFFE